jgi:lipid-A-disaccharide synthase
MTPRRFMLIAGETSGDTLAAELVMALRAAAARQNTYTSDAQPLRADLAPRFFGAGGPRMAAAGVELAFDLTAHSMVGVPGPRTILKFKRFGDQLLALARERQPHAIILVDFNEFNLRFASRLHHWLRSRRGTFNNWQPKLVKYVSPQVWASRESRAWQIARDFDLLLSIFPFEKSWYAARVPQLPVEFIGHPMLDRYQAAPPVDQSAESAPSVVLLPGSRRRELERHLPVMLAAFKMIQAAIPAARATMVLPDEALVHLARQMADSGNGAAVNIQVGGLPAALTNASVAIASTGTVTMECAFFGVPTVTLYITSTLQWQIAKRIVKVRTITMPNLLADDAVFPEFLQHTATPDNLARAALDFLREPARCEKTRVRLREIIATLGGPGAGRRAAEAILKILE